MVPVPTSRLILIVLVVAGVAAAAGPLPALKPLWLVLMGGAGVLALLDLATSFRLSRFPVPSLPPVVRFSKDRSGQIPLTFACGPGVVRRARLGLGLPPVFTLAEPDVQIQLPADATQARVSVAATPTRRGRFTSVLVCLEIGSRLGLWRLRHRREVRSELRVYPNLFAEGKQLAALFLSRGQLGSRLQRTVGRGREFEKLRDYLPGDGFDEIHWKATAKRGRPITKIFQAERTQEIYVAIDVSRLSARPVMHQGVTETALDRYLTASLVLLLAAERQGDRFGLVVYDDRVRVFLRPGNGDSHYAACREALHALQSSEATPDMAEIVRHLRAQIRRRSLLFFLTDLTDPVLAEDFARHGKLLAGQHLVLVNQLRAPGVSPLFSSGEIKHESEIYGKLAGHARWAEIQAQIKTFKPLGLSVALLEDETLAGQLVTQYLGIKQRQSL